MFSKLLKHEWKANAALLGLLSLCAIGAGLLGGGVLWAIRALSEQANEQLQGSLTGISGLSTLLFFLILSIAAYAFAVLFINVMRFYKSRYTDEGYLTFTLPVTAKQIFLSSFVYMLLWQVISVVVVAIAMACMLLIGLPKEVLETIKPIVSVLTGLDGILETLPGYRLYSVLLTVQVVFKPVYGIVLLMTSVTLGAVIAKKHKIWTAIGMYFGIQLAVGIVESILSAVPTLMLLFTGLMGGENYLYNLSVTAGLGIALQVGLSIGFFFLSTNLMRKKLNLP